MKHLTRRRLKLVEHDHASDHIELQEHAATPCVQEDAGLLDASPRRSPRSSIRSVPQW